MKFSKQVNNDTFEEFWNVLIVDDEEDVHTLTKLVLKNFTYKDKKVKFYDSYNIEDTKDLLNGDIEFSLILLDIIMERDDAGLSIVKYIRDELQDDLVRIILRTGQPGTYPEEKIILDYDINDYKEKTELTSIKLKSSLISSFRSYEELKKIKNHKEILEDKVEENILELRKKDRLIEHEKRVSQSMDLINMLAHQWRQPLSVISVNANNLLVDIELENIDIETFKRLINNIVSTTQVLSKKIDDFLTHYKPSTTKRVFTVEELSNDILKLIENKVSESNIKLITNLNKEYEIENYKSELAQIIVHLIENAIEAYEDNEILEKTIKLESTIEDDNLIIFIEDEAGGLSEEIIKEVFMPYFSTKENCNDTGLGLYMSKLLVEKHLNGELSLSNKGKGCLAKIVLFSNEI